MRHGNPVAVAGDRRARGLHGPSSANAGCSPLPAACVRAKQGRAARPAAHRHRAAASLALGLAPLDRACRWTARYSRAWPARCSSAVQIPEARGRLGACLLGNRLESSVQFEAAGWRSRAGVPRPGAEAHGSETGARVTPPRPSLPGRRTLGVSADAFLRRMHGMFEYRLSTGAIASRIPDSRLEDE